ncbi:putative triacylglycerol lipase [Dioscorea sansibarensis]
MNTQNFITISIILLLSLLHLSFPIHARPLITAKSSNISAVFAFGDSTLDSGNNDKLPTLVRADHPPYGQNFPGRVATGRFSNGKLITDFLASGIHLKEALPPYLATGLFAEDLSTGLSFASAGSGYDDLTAQLSSVITMNQQLQYFKDYLQRMSVAGKDNKFVSDAVFVIGAGSNDMIMNFYTLPMRKFTFTLDQYQDFLQSKLSSFVKQLYNMGGRKFTVAGLPPLGCIPLQITNHVNTKPGPPGPRSRACVDEQNDDSMKYNSKLQTTLNDLQKSLPGLKIVYVDIYNPLMDMINNPMKYGFTETKLGCCGTGTSEMGPLCSVPLPTCPDPSKFIFWDSVHPSEAAYKALADEFMQTVLPQITN